MGMALLLSYREIGCMTLSSVIHEPLSFDQAVTLVYCMALLICGGYLNQSAVT